MKYFNNPQTLEELKKQYHHLAFLYHPDRGGDEETMKAINAEFDELFLILKDIHKTWDGDTYTSSQPNTETANQFKDIIDELMRMEDIIIEIIGCFVWVTGDTTPYKEKLKEMNFRWQSKKRAWYLKPEDYIFKSRREYDFDEIRAKYGTSGEINSTGSPKLTKVPK